MEVEVKRKVEPVMESAFGEGPRMRRDVAERSPEPETRENAALLTNRTQGLAEAKGPHRRAKGRVCVHVNV